MESTGEQGKKQPGKGFAGLSSMVSDVDKTLSAAAAESSARPAARAARPGAVPPPKERAEGQAGRRSATPPPVPQSSGSGGKRLLKWGAAAVVIYVLWQGANHPSSRSEYSPPATTGSIEYPAPAPTGSIAFPAPVATAEERPPVGTDLVLGPAQLRYCLSEKIRLSAAQTVLNTYLESDVNRFNAMVDDYNSRCGAFRYRSGSLESTQRDVEGVRYILEAEGRGRFTQGAGGQ